MFPRVPAEVVNMDGPTALVITFYLAIVSVMSFLPKLLELL